MTGTSLGATGKIRINKVLCEQSLVETKLEKQSFTFKSIRKSDSSAPVEVKKFTLTLLKL